MKKSLQTFLFQHVILFISVHFCSQTTHTLFFCLITSVKTETVVHGEGGNAPDDFKDFMFEILYALKSSVLCCRRFLILFRHSEGES